MANNLTKIIAGLLIAIAVLLGIYAWVLGRSASSPPPAQPMTAVTAVPIVIATRTLPGGQPIPADALKVQPTTVPAPAGAFNDPALLVGRMPIRDVPASTPVVADALVSGLAEDVQPGERAVAVRVDETNAVGNRLRPGNFVDVFLNLKREVGTTMLDGEVSQTQARLLLSKVRVLSFGDATAERDSGNNNGGNGQPTGARIAVLAVPTAQVDALTLGEASGRLTFALRNPRDEELALQTVAVRTDNKLSPSALAAAGVSLQQLSGTPRTPVASANVPPLPSHLPPPVRPSGGGGSIEVIRGGRSETVAY
ncbi:MULTISPECIES: Flp pilus assembly protein CpaB [Burkholderia]|jgi:pilus assembly protein CpaB|uniref:Flp pilus assembly protein CpaB n=1 Tax=Burkholderia cenocepacia TaxID=95486 RepID=A0ABD4UD81_9BURK|nr:MULTISPECIES: Flp pilus assembly protein CpaB [Burkholderia]AMU07105.1 Flp pilus assembly protein CpaB [Burkholderia cenocepacia]AQQ20154.1 Flp pilus assembly protein CpaB [Burkholderia cenocepacia]ARF84695.1 Flp pilus assembly protein RcpC/CpaB [Burkholderia cenocepacia]MBG0867483.1 Flp pilus assembly protein CpaB [Burkholderia sp. 9779_493]MBJ9897174.1 Flp pilus assembly protein CpaB [Burkholderia cenocepacia]